MSSRASCTAGMVSWRQCLYSLSLEWCTPTRTNTYNSALVARDGKQFGQGVEVSTGNSLYYCMAHASHRLSKTASSQEARPYLCWCGAFLFSRLPSSVCRVSSIFSSKACFCTHMNMTHPHPTPPHSPHRAPCTQRRVRFVEVYTGTEGCSC